MLKSEKTKGKGFVVKHQGRTKYAKIDNDDLECREYGGEPKRPHRHYTAVIADTATTRFIMDAGCGHDLISEEKASGLQQASWDTPVLRPKTA